MGRCTGVSGTADTEVTGCLLFSSWRIAPRAAILPHKLFVVFAFVPLWMAALQASGSLVSDGCQHQLERLRLYHLMVQVLAHHMKSQA